MMAIPALTCVSLAWLSPGCHRDREILIRCCLVTSGALEALGALGALEALGALRALGANPIPVQLPIGAEKEFAGFVDLIRMKYVEFIDDSKDGGRSYMEGEIPEEHKEAAEAAQVQSLPGHNFNLRVPRCMCLCILS